MTTLTELKNFRLFDGVSEEIRAGGSVLVEHDTIREVSDRPVRAGDANVIDCGGRFLMPGLIDLHFHAYSSQRARRTDG